MSVLPKFLFPKFCNSDLRFIVLFFKQVFESWKEIENVMRERIFEENEEESIDIFDLKVKTSFKGNWCYNNILNNLDGLLYM